MRVLRVGVYALLLEVDTTSQVHALTAELMRRRAVGEFNAAEIVPGARTVLVDGIRPVAGVPDAGDPIGFVATSVPEWGPLSTLVHSPVGEVEVPTVYNGPDLDVVALHWGVPPGEVRRRHEGITYTVAFCGFAPGFAYLTGLPAEWSVPRRATPRPRVPAGSVALAGIYTAVYPGISPGGWLLIGTTTLRLFDADASPPALLTPGTRVRFVDA